MCFAVASVVVSINGKWGVGKTYFWHQFKEQLTDKKVAYVSLFGKETISSIRTDVFLHLSSVSLLSLSSSSFKIITTLQFFCSFRGGST
jgi:hypothetical protein